MSEPVLSETSRTAALGSACEATGTPGAVLGVLHEGRVEVTAYGVLHTATCASVRPDSVFQIGSITKPWTATLIAQLGTEGRLSLDTPLVELLPDLRLGEHDRAGEVTVRHLLAHSAGFDGDLFADTGRGDDAVARYVDLLGGVPEMFVPGGGYSYNNAGYVLLGHVVATLDGGTWEESLRERLTVPWGLDDVCLLPEEALLRSAAVGHLEGGRPVSAWQLPRSLGPAGLVTTSAATLLAWAARWCGPDVPEHLAAMTTTLGAVPDGSDLDGIGWGWRTATWQDTRVIGHSGATLGQSAQLRVLPEHHVAICLLTNASASEAVLDRILPGLVHDLTGLTTPPPPAPAPEAAPPEADPAQWVGRYRRLAADYDVTQDADGALWVTATPAGELAEHLGPVRRTRLLPRDPTGTAFVRREDDHEPWSTVTFAELPDATPYLFSQGRIAPRVASC